MRIIYQLIEKSSGKRCEPMAADYSELRRVLSDFVSPAERENYYVLIVMNERPDAEFEEHCEDVMVFSTAPLMLLSTYIGGYSNVA